MNKQLSDFARQTIKDGLNKLTEEQQLMFKRMYSHKNLDLVIDKVVDNMKEEHLDHAMTQIQNSLAKLNQQ